jgi:hypothetical protein
MQTGMAQFHSGHWQSVESLQKALQSDPLDPVAFSIRSALAQFFIALREDTAALATASYALHQNQDFAWA